MSDHDINWVCQTVMILKAVKKKERDKTMKSVASTAALSLEISLDPQTMLLDTTVKTFEGLQAKISKLQFLVRSIFRAKGRG